MPTLCFGLCPLVFAASGLPSENPSGALTLPLRFSTVAFSLTFAVGDDSPYFSGGYTNGKLYTNTANGVAIEGPSAELYKKLFTTGFSSVIKDQMQSSQSENAWILSTLLPWHVLKLKHETSHH